MKRFLLAATSLILLHVGCGTTDDSVPPAGVCAEANVVGDACAGAPAETTGDTSACGTVHTANGAGELEAALSGASANDCVLLESGTYEAIALPANVSLFGVGAADVQVASIEVASGTSVIADVTVQSGTVTVRAGADAHLSGTRIIGSGSDGLLIEEGGSATVTRSEITGSARYGISAFDAASVTLDGALIEGSSGPGVWISCGGGCECAGSVSSTIKNTIIRDNRIVGLSFIGTSGTLDNVVVSDTTVGSNFEAGGGVSISGCSNIDASELTVMGNTDFGMLVDDSTLELESGTIDSNLRGLWVQRIGSTQATDRVRILDTVLSGNEGVGFGVDKASLNVAIERSQITDTRLVAMPVLVNGVSANVLEVGDGLSWLGTSQVSVVDLSLSNNARVGVLIDGPVGSGSSIADLSSSGTSGTLELLQQNLPAGGEQPATSGTTPALESDTSERLAIPSEIAIPPSI